MSAEAFETDCGKLFIYFSTGNHVILDSMKIEDRKTNLMCIHRVMYHLRISLVRVGGLWVIGVVDSDNTRRGTQEGINLRFDDWMRIGKSPSSAAMTAARKIGEDFCGRLNSGEYNRQLDMAAYREIVDDFNEATKKVQKLEKELEEAKKIAHGLKYTLTNHPLNVETML